MWLKMANDDQKLFQISRISVYDYFRFSLTDHQYCYLSKDEAYLCPSPKNLYKNLIFVLIIAVKNYQKWLKGFSVGKCT